MSCLVCDAPSDDDLCGRCWDATPEPMRRLIGALERAVEVGPVDEFAAAELADTRHAQLQLLGRVA